MGHALQVCEALAGLTVVAKDQNRSPWPLSRPVYAQKIPNTREKRLRPVKGFPGGQFVLVNEAVNLGIAIYNMRQGRSPASADAARPNTGRGLAPLL